MTIVLHLSEPDSPEKLKAELADLRAQLERANAVIVEQQRELHEAGREIYAADERAKRWEAEALRRGAAAEPRMEPAGGDERAERLKLRFVPAKGHA